MISSYEILNTFDFSKYASLYTNLIMIRYYNLTNFDFLFRVDWHFKIMLAKYSVVLI